MSQTLPVWFSLLSSAALGAVLGSFLNVCIYRIPRRLSLVFPPSSCPHCRKRIAPYDNVPILGWLLLRGRCRSCREKISLRYPVIEILTAVLFAALTLHFGLTWELLPALVFAAAMLVVTVIDFDSYTIPDAITLPGIPAGLLASLLTPLTLLDAVLGAGLGFLFLLAVGWGYQKATGVEGMGGGDVKLAAMLGAFLGWKGVLLTVFGASAAGALAGALLMSRRGTGGKTMLPFGTFLAPVALVVYVWGGTWIDAYLRWAAGLGG